MKINFNGTKIPTDLDYKKEYSENIMNKYK